MAAIHAVSIVVLLILVGADAGQTSETPARCTPAAGWLLAGILLAPIITIGAIVWSVILRAVRAPRHPVRAARSVPGRLSPRSSLRLPSSPRAPTANLHLARRPTAPNAASTRPAQRLGRLRHPRRMPQAGQRLTHPRPRLRLPRHPPLHIGQARRHTCFLAATSTSRSTTTEHLTTPETATQLHDSNRPHKPVSDTP
jgi:hypothetical protein